MLPKNIDLFSEFIDNNKIIKSILKNIPQTQEVWKARKKYLDYNSEGRYNGSSDPEFGHDFLTDNEEENEK